MGQQLDIFRVDSTGDLIWLAGADTLSLAKLRVKSLLNSRPADYVIVNKKTGYKLYARVAEAGGAATKSRARGLHVMLNRVRNAERCRRVNLVRNWLVTDTKLPPSEVQSRFAKLGIHLSTPTVLAYCRDAKTLINRELLFGPGVAQQMFPSVSRQGRTARRKCKSETVEVVVN